MFFEKVEQNKKHKKTLAAQYKKIFSSMWRSAFSANFPAAISDFAKMQALFVGSLLPFEDERYHSQ